ncbi:MAG: hypothetical protein H8E28_11745 [Anaerolineae bacterium]|nr:hypothetical protein [Anaerolineae bacterium]
MIDSTNTPSPNLRFILLVTAILVGSFVRLVHPLSGTYPLNDGGLFYTMVQDLSNSPVFLPHFTSYNHTQIPYAYPPLAFFLTNWIAALTRFPLMELIRLLPAIFSTLTIPAFYNLARRLLPTTNAALLSTFGFALLPTAFDPLIVGAGLTRAPGLFFALLTLSELHALYTQPNRIRLARTAIFAGLTLLSHPGMAWFTAYSSALLLIFHTSRGIVERIKLSFVAAVGTLALTAPWWITIITRHGLNTLLSPFQTEAFSLTALLTPFSLLFTNEALVAFLAVFGFLGFLSSLRVRRWLIPAWLLGVFIFEPRLGAAYAAVPAALLAGTGIEVALLNLDENQPRAVRVHPAYQFALGFLLIYGVVAAYLAPNYARLSSEQVEAMQWARENTAAADAFIVLTGARNYGTDYTSEWFPTLSERSSLATPQGHEWLPDGEFNRRAELHATLQSCAGEDFACLETWVAGQGIRPTYLFISKKAFSENGFDSRQMLSALNAISTPIFENSTTVIYPWP